MATIEKLFNFDDQLLARQIAGQRDDFNMGQLAPGPWGMMGAGINRIGRGLFNSNDDLLKEKAAAEGALATVQAQLGEDISDPDKLYPALIKELAANGANPKSILQVQEVYAAQSAVKAKTSLDTLKFQTGLETDLIKIDETNEKNTNQVIQNNTKDLQTRIKTDPGFGTAELKAMGFNDPEGIGLVTEFQGMIEETLSYTDERGNPKFKTVDSAVQHIKKTLDKHRNSEAMGYDEGMSLNPFDDDEVNTQYWRTLIAAEAGQNVDMADAMGQPAPPGWEYTGDIVDGEPTLKRIGE